MKKILSTTLMGLAFAGSVQALTISSSFITPLATTDLGSFSSPLSNALDLYDPSLGTLNSITLTLSAHSVSTTILSNGASAAQFFEYNSDLNFFFGSSLAAVNSAIGGDVFAIQLQTNLATTGGSVVLGSGASLDLGTKTDDKFVSFTFNSGDAAFAELIAGPGTFDLTCFTSTTSTFTGGGGNINTDQVSQGQCDGSVEYDYTEDVIVDPNPTVASPASLVLMSLGLAGFGFGRRASKKA